VAENCAEIFQGYFMQLKTLYLEKYCSITGKIEKLIRQTRPERALQFEPDKIPLEIRYNHHKSGITYQLDSQNENASEIQGDFNI
jgi:hypothetical protein